jgi:hypothetical protein
MKAKDAARAALGQAPGEPFCTACLAFACSTSWAEMWQVADGLLRDNRHVSSSADAACSRCLRVTTTFVHLEGKCAHCSRRIRDAGGVVHGGEHFHSACWNLLVSSTQIRVSRQLSRQSRALIAAARMRLDGPR